MQQNRPRVPKSLHNSALAEIAPENSREEIEEGESQQLVG